MLWIRSVAVAATFAKYGLAKELVPNDLVGAELYESGVMMERIMMQKEVCDDSDFLVLEPAELTAFQTKWDQLRKAGRFASEQYPNIDTVVKCVNGLATAIPGNASYTFRCNNVRLPSLLAPVQATNILQIDLYNFKSHTTLGSKVGEGSSSWGWTSPEGREFIALGQADGAAFIEISKEGKIIYLGRLPRTTGARPVIWREIRGFKDYVIIGSESETHGIQIFDMRKV